MPEETKIPRLQEQIDKVEQIVNHTPFRMFVTGVVGGIFFGALRSAVLGRLRSLVGFADIRCAA